MSSPRPRPAFERALSQLRALAAEARAGDGRPLPAIRVLAFRAGVSPLTMWKAVRRLSTEGVLQTVPRAQVRAAEQREMRARAEPQPEAPVVASVSTPPAAQPRWVELRDRIASDLLALRFAGTGPLPSLKELCAHYEVGRLTVGRALRALTADGWLERSGRRFRRVPARPRRIRASVVYLAEQPGGDVLTDLTPRSLGLWRVLEERCHLSNVRFVVRSVSDYLVGRLRRGEPGVLGYIVRNLDIDPALAERLLGRLAESGLPVGLVDEVGQTSRLEWPRRSSRFRTFAIAHSDVAGRQVGQRLLQLGHRRVALFSPFEQRDWSRNRLNGIASSFARLGTGAAVAYVAPAFPDHDSVRRAVTGAAGYAALARRIEAFRARLDPTQLSADRGALFRDPLFQSFASEAVASRMRPLFESALSARPQATAWVGANDTVALAAARFLRQAGRRVPVDAAVVGFDNTLEALREGLASYDFNLPALASALLDHVLGWRTRPGRDRGPVVEIPGLLVERESLGPAAEQGAETRTRA
jgi:DNA-binding LacI/PurR family transcriptional regulator/DNA-binding transcriptional regulator YhcF (GntR family)